VPSILKEFLLGRPLPTSQLRHQRLNKAVALAVFSSDALSSVAYATEEILIVLVAAGTSALALSMPIAAAISVLLLIVATSYRQTIKAYPCGGGAYIVAKDNLGTWPGLVAGAALLVDYVLTVAVSISAGTAAVTSAFEPLLRYRVVVALAFLALLILANLRGVRESGAIFAGPTYLFIAGLATLILVGLWRYATGSAVVVPHQAVGEIQGLTLFMVLRAFASGCTAMTGVEAISNGVQAFKEPAAPNARVTLSWMAGILAFLFLGTTALARLSGVQPSSTQTIISQMARGVFGDGALYFILQASTAAILVLAANTSFADFPRLASFMAEDRFLPNQLKGRGDRLVFSNGVLLLGALSAALIIIFRGVTHLLIPLYAVGVFTAFTMSQAGMVRHWLSQKGSKAYASIAVNGLGAVTTGVVLVVIAVAKFAAGAWVVVLMIPLLVTTFSAIKRHYDSVAEKLYVPLDEPIHLRPLHNHVLLLVSGVNKSLIRAIQYAKSLSADELTALFIDVTGEGAGDIRGQWAKAGIDIPLKIVDSPYRELIQPLTDYIRALPHKAPNYVVTVILPEFVPDQAVTFALHNQTAFRIKGALFFEPGVIVTDVPYHLGR
jgi:amino acid transporter